MDRVEFAIRICLLLAIIVMAGIIANKGSAWAGLIFPARPALRKSEHEGDEVHRRRLQVGSKLGRNQTSEPKAVEGTDSGH